VLILYFAISNYVIFERLCIYGFMALCKYFIIIIITIRPSLVVSWITLGYTVLINNDVTYFTIAIVATYVSSFTAL